MKQQVLLPSQDKTRHFFWPRLRRSRLSKFEKSPEEKGLNSKLPLIISCPFCLHFSRGGGSTLESLMLASQMSRLPSIDSANVFRWWHGRSNALRYYCHQSSPEQMLTCSSMGTFELSTVLIYFVEDPMNACQMGNHRTTKVLLPSHGVSMEKLFFWCRSWLQ